MVEVRGLLYMTVGVMNKVGFMEVDMLLSRSLSSVKR